MCCQFDIYEFTEYAYVAQRIAEKYIEEHIKQHYLKVEGRSISEM